ncbi:hypothetical protein BDW22DRAFT_1431463 [Trametopsis cervina]|nr:hypothetical protein BDW22DRAFT_1431463 [Trametopsis cervina]
MADVDSDNLREVVSRIVNAASKDGTIHELTPRMIREKAEEDMQLDSGALKVYKDEIKEIAQVALEALDGNAEEEEKISVEKTQPSKKTKTISKRKSETAITDEDATPPSKKPKAAPKRQPRKAETKPSSAKGKNTKTIRSASVIPSSEDEASPEKKSPPKAAPKAKRPTLPKNTSAHDADVSTADIGDIATPVKAGKKRAQQAQSEDNDSPATPKASHSALPQSAEAEDVEMGNEQGPPVPKATMGEKSDSEMSVVMDEPTKRGRKRKDKAEASATKKKRKPKEPTEESPDDQEIKRLKSFVVACGVRKVWSKEFKDISEDKRAQIRKLKEILAGLGMTGRLSMERAKSIKEKRELAQELEDVQTFEKAVVSGPVRSSRKTVPESSGGNESDIEDAPALPRKKTNARASIMAFLGDQSDSE